MDETEGLFIENKHAECYQCKDAGLDFVPGLSFRKDTTTSALLQIRTRNGIGEFGRGVKRNMLAHMSLDRGELMKLRDAINEILPKLTEWPHP